MHRVLLNPATLLFVTGVISCIGCGKSSDLEKVIVTGNVTLDGQAIPNGEIRFFPIEGTLGSVAGGPIKNGAYTAESKGGVPVGKHRVEIRAFRAPTGQQTGSAAIEGGPAEQYLPPNYNTNTELQVTVDSSEKTHDFQLKSN